MAVAQRCSELFHLTFAPLQVDSRPPWSSDGTRMFLPPKGLNKLFRLYTIFIQGRNPRTPGSGTALGSNAGMVAESNPIIYSCVPGVDDPSIIALYRIDLRTCRSEGHSHGSLGAVTDWVPSEYLRLVTLPRGVEMNSMRVSFSSSLDTKKVVAE